MWVWVVVVAGRGRRVRIERGMMGVFLIDLQHSGCLFVCGCFVVIEQMYRGIECKILKYTEPKRKADEETQKEKHHAHHSLFFRWIVVLLFQSTQFQHSQSPACLFAGVHARLFSLFPTLDHRTSHTDN